MKLARSFITALILFGLGTIVLSLYQIPAVRDNIALATTIKPETFTELYFENHEKLNKQADINKPQTFSFTIHNVENQEVTYPYEVYVESTDGKRSQIIKDIVKLKNDETKTIPVTFELLQPVTRAKVVVKLTNKNQEIHYWIGEENK